jgi:hypothetical protein
MTSNGGISDELSPHIERGEAAALDCLAERLESERPLPRAGFRAELHMRFADVGQRWRPRRLGLAVGAYLTSGLTLLSVAAIGLTGVGPLGY